MSFYKKIQTKLEKPSDDVSDRGQRGEVPNDSFHRFVESKKKPAQKEIRSLTGEIIDQKRMAELRKTKFVILVEPSSKFFQRTAISYFGWHCWWFSGRLTFLQL